MSRFDVIQKAAHYNRHASGIECIELVQHLPFCLGNLLKYVWRTGHKQAALVDLQKALYYLDRERARIDWPDIDAWQQLLTLARRDYPRVMHALRIFGVRPWTYVDDVLLAHIAEKGKGTARRVLLGRVRRVVDVEQAQADAEGQRLSPLGIILSPLLTMLSNDGPIDRRLFHAEMRAFETMRELLAQAVAREELAQASRDSASASPSEQKA